MTTHLGFRQNRLLVPLEHPGISKFRTLSKMSRGAFWVTRMCLHLHHTGPEPGLKNSCLPTYRILGFHKTGKFVLYGDAGNF